MGVVKENALWYRPIIKLYYGFNCMKNAWSIISSNIYSNPHTSNKAYGGSWFGMSLLVGVQFRLQQGYQSNFIHWSTKVNVIPYQIIIKFDIKIVTLVLIPKWFLLCSKVQLWWQFDWYLVPAYILICYMQPIKLPKHLYDLFG